MDNRIKFIGIDGKEAKVLPFQYQGNSVVIAIAGSGMSFDRKTTQTFIESCIKSQKKSGSTQTDDNLTVSYDEVQLILVEFFDGSSRFEVRLLNKNLIALEKHINTISDAINSFYEYADRDTDLMASMQKFIDIGESSEKRH